ncbi:MAG: PQQ-binding-like beta-propeller repeat protein [Gemmataceae bacterium]
MSTSPPDRPGDGPAVAAPSRRVHYRIPIALALLTVAGPLLPRLWHWSDLDPAPIFMLGFAGMWMLVLGTLGLLGWFFAFSGLSWRTRLLGLGGLALVGGGVVAAVDEFKLDGNMRPIPHFRWQPRAQERLAEYLDETSGDQLPPVEVAVDPVNDFPRYRGVRADGVINPSELLNMRWDEAAPRELWRHPCGGGFAGFAVAGNVAITVEQRGDDEAIVCYDRATGRQRWVHAYPASFRHPTGSGPRATPTLDQGDVFSLGALGDLVCVDAATGKRRWAVNILTDNGAKNVTWGMTSSPLVADDLVIVNAGIDPDKNVGQAVAAYHRRDGKRVWASGKYPAGYSSAQLATLAGRRQVLLFDGGGLAGFDPKTGAELWRYPWETFSDMNIIQPLVIDGDRVLISSETKNGCALLRILRRGDEYSVEPVWENRMLCSKYANPVRLGGAIYGLSNSTLVCLDVETGKRHWRGKSYGHGQVLGVSGAVVVLGEQGQLAVVPADPRRFREAYRVDVFKDRTWNTPAVAGRQLFVRNDVEMACFELPLKQ